MSPKKSSYLDDDEIVRMDSADDKTGERRKSALITVAGVAIGAFLGDTFYGRDYMIYDEGYDTYWNENWSVQFEQRDTGGVLEDVGLVNQPDQYTLTESYIDQDGAQFIYKEHMDEDYVSFLRDTGFFEGMNDQVIRTGALIGGSVGGGSAYAIDRFSRKLRERKAEKKGDDPAAIDAS